MTGQLPQAITSIKEESIISHSKGILSKQTRRNRTNETINRKHIQIIGIKEIFQYTPSDEDISQLLKEFTSDFLLNGTLTHPSVKLHHLIV